MAYRPIVVDGPQGTEVIQTRLSDAAFQEWLERRPALAAEGKPDRPPDVDLPTLQSWLPHPGEEHPFFDDRDATALEAAEQLAGWPVYAASWRDADRQTVVTMTALADGGYYAHVTELVAGKPTDKQVQKDYPAGSPPEVVDEDFTKVLSIVNHYEGPTDKVSLPTDFDALEVAIQEAAADIALTFGPSAPAAHD